MSGKRLYAMVLAVGLIAVSAVAVLSVTVGASKADCNTCSSCNSQ